MLTALRLEEEKQKRLERTKILKLILGKKLGAKELRKMMIRMEQLTLEDLEMEVEEVEDKIIELMEIEEESMGPRDDENSEMDLSSQEEEVDEESDDKATTDVSSIRSHGSGISSFVPFVEIWPDSFAVYACLMCAV